MLAAICVLVMSLNLGDKLTVDDAVKIAERYATIPSHSAEEHRAALLMYVLQAEPGRGDALKMLQDNVKNLRKNMPVGGQARKDRLEQIRAASLRAALMRDGVTFPPPPPFFMGYAKNQVGTHDGLGRVISVSGSTVIIRRGGEYLALDGFGADSIADGGDVALYGIVMECLGTKSHTLPNGVATTIWTFRPFASAKALAEWESLRIHSWAEWPGAGK